MITEEHLNHWISEIRYQLKGALNELGRSEGVSKGIALNDKLYISFEYLLEKTNTANRILKSIEDDMKNDD